jgi:hypothetical protein
MTMELTSFPNPFLNFFSSEMRVTAVRVMMRPCPMSPNMTAKRKGKVMTVKSPGLISWYEATPYESIMAWNPPVNLFVRWNVGGFLALRSSWRMAGTLPPEFSWKRERRQRGRLR